MEYKIQGSILVNRTIEEIEKKLELIIHNIDGKIITNQSDSTLWIYKYVFQTIRCKTYLVSHEKNTEIVIAVDSDYINLPGSKKIITDFKKTLLNNEIKCLKNIPKDSQTLTKQNTKITPLKNRRKKKENTSNSQYKQVTLESQIKSNFVIIGIAVIFILFIISIVIDSPTKQKIENNPWDSSVTQVELYVLHHINDRDSYYSLEWSKVIKNNEDEYRVRHKYRFKNDYGDIVVENQIFILDKEGNVINVWSPN